MCNSNVEMLQKRQAGDNPNEQGDILDTIGDHQVPPHTLKLKIGDVCMVMRNLDIDHGLTNNLRVRILKITKFSSIIYN